MAIIEPQLAIFWPGVGITQVYPACPDGLDLGTFENNTGLKALLDMIVVASFAINGYHAGTLCHVAILAPEDRASNLWHTFWLEWMLSVRLPRTFQVLAMTKREVARKDKNEGPARTIRVAKRLEFLLFLLQPFFLGKCLCALFYLISFID